MAARILAGALAGAGATVVLNDAYPDAIPSLGLSRPKDIKLTYFDIAGVADKVRIAMHIGGIAFEDDRVSFAQWPSIKPTTPNGQLPLMESGGKRYTQSSAMLQLVGKLTGLQSRDPWAALLVDEVIGLDEDFRKKVAPSVYVAYDKSLSARQKKAKIAPMRKTIAEEDIPFYFSRFEKKLEENEYLTGPKVTIADVQFLTTVRWMSSGILDGIPATCLDPFPKIKAFKEKMEAIPEVAAYLESTKKK